MDDCFRQHEPIHIYVYAPVFEGLALHGSGDIDGAAKLVTPLFNLHINGSGDAVLDLETEQLEININGSGDVRLAGSAQRQDIFISGSGKVEAFELWTSVTSIVISGSGDCRVYAEDELAVRINGSGSVYYKGNPAIT